MDLSIFSPIVAVASLVIIAFSARELSNKHQSDVRVIWYLFSLAVVLTYLVAAWAKSINAIDDGGRFHGTTGQVISFLLKAALDIESSMLLGLSILVLVFGPQIISYLLSGLTGCAASPILLGGTLSFVTWGLVKTFAVASGVILTVSLYAQFGALGDWSISKTLGSVLLSTMLIAIAFITLYVYRELPLIPSALTQLCPQPVVQRARSIKKWLTRKSRDEPQV